MIRQLTGELTYTLISLLSCTHLVIMPVLKIYVMCFVVCFLYAVCLFCFVLMEV